MTSFRFFPLQRRALTVLAVVVAFATNAFSQTPVTLNFVDADIDVVAKAVGELTGKTFVLDPRVKGKINIQSAKGVAPGLAYPTFLSALRMAGFAAVEGPGGIVRVVPEVDAKALPTAVAGAGSANSSYGGAITTKVIPLVHQSAGQIINALRPLVAAANALTVYPPGNAIIITDYGDNIRKVEAVIARLDTPNVAAPELVTLTHANAMDIVATLNRVYADAGGATAESRDRLFFTADSRSNSVILRSEDAGRLARARSLILELDRPSGAPGNIRIVYLKHADAAQVAQTLRRVLGAESGGAGSGSSSGSALSSLLPTGGPATTPVSPLAAATAALTGSASTGNTTSSGSLPSLSSNATTAFTAAGATVYADTTINALVISAPTAIYNNLRAVIEQLDVRRAQVFIEALIAEVQADRAAEFGIQWQALDGIGRGGTQGVGGTNFGNAGATPTSNILGVAANVAAVGQGLNIGLVRGAVTIAGKQFLNLGLLARALQSDVSANILSMPTLLALDNEEARFSGGQTVPVLTGQYANSSGTNNAVTPFATFDRKDVGLILRVKPLITEGGAIRLQLYQEVSSVAPSTTTGVDAAGLSTFNKRVLETSVLAEDGQIVVLGGLLQEGFTNDQEKVPVLGDVPFFGNLFRYDTRKRNKTNLMIFLRPTVIRSPTQSITLSNERYRALGMEQQSVTPESRPMLPDMTNPTLPLGPPAAPRQ